MVCLFSFTCTFFNRSFRTLFPRFLLCSFFRSSIKKNFEKMGLSQFWLANIVCVRIIASIIFVFIRAPYLFQVVDGASIYLIYFSEVAQSPVIPTHTSLLAARSSVRSSLYAARYSVFGSCFSFLAR